MVIRIALFALLAALLAAPAAASAATKPVNGADRLLRQARRQPRDLHAGAQRQRAEADRHRGPRRSPGRVAARPAPGVHQVRTLGSAGVDHLPGRHRAAPAHHRIDATRCRPGRRPAGTWPSRPGRRGGATSTGSWPTAPASSVSPQAGATTSPRPGRPPIGSRSCAAPPARRDIYTMSARGGSPRRLTRSRLDDRGPAWSPTGQDPGVLPRPRREARPLRGRRRRAALAAPDRGPGRRDRPRLLTRRHPGGVHAPPARPQAAVRDEGEGAAGPDPARAQPPGRGASPPRGPPPAHRAGSPPGSTR